MAKSRIVLDTIKGRDPDELRLQLTLGMHEALEALEESVEPLVPRGASGHLAESFEKTVHSEPGVVVGELATNKPGGPDVFYGKFQEFGTKRGNRLWPQPFMRPGFQRALQTVRLQFRAGIRRWLKRGQA